MVTTPNSQGLLGVDSQLPKTPIRQTEASQKHIHILQLLQAVPTLACIVLGSWMKSQSFPFML